MKQPEGTEFPQQGAAFQQQGVSMVLRSIPLLQTKLHIPPVHPMSIPRPRLMAQLHKSRAFKLTLISAPTGFGKTTLLSEWAGHHTLPVTWVSLNESDNDPARFWAYFIAALTSLLDHTEASERIMELLYQDSVEAILAEIINLIASISQEFMLILDDYHTIQNPQIHTALTSLLEYLPAHMHICISSRTRPPLPLPRLRAYRQLHELRPTDLLFTLEEIETFLARALGQEPPPDQASIIKMRTEGWIAILHLVAIWLQEQQDGWEALERIPSNHRYILDYLAEEVLQRQPQTVQSFLLQTSVLAQFNSDLCADVTGQSEAWLLLEQIEQANLFIIPLDSQQHWYSYHQIFRTFLHERLERLLPDLLPSLHRRACAWYEQHGMPSEAITHALAIQDFEKAAEIILKDGENLLMRGEFSTLISWLKALPEEFVRLYPLLCLFYACSLMMIGQFDAAEIWIKNIDYIDKKTSFIPATMQQSLEPKEQAPFVRNLISVLRAHIAIFWGEISDVANLTLQAQDALPQESTFAQSLNLLNVGVAQWLAGDIGVAEETFTAAEANGKLLQNNYIILAADCGLTLTHMMRGKRRLAFAIAQQALQLSSKHRSYLSPFSIYLYTETSYLLYEWNRLDEATYYAQEVLVYGEKHNMDVLMYSYTILSCIKQAQGDFAEAQVLLQRAEECIARSQRRPWVLSRLAEQYVRLALACNDISCAEHWAQVPYLHQFGSLAVILPMRVFLAKNQPCEALKLAQMYLPGAERKPGGLMPVILQARAYQQLGKMSEALHMLDCALRQAEPEGYIRFFLDEGSAFAQLLRLQLETYERQTRQYRHASSRTGLIRYVRLLLAEFAKEERAPSASSGKPARLPAGLPDELSERELEVLRCITAGLSNQEIARQIIVAESTVKWHVKNIYSKLQVHNRAQAIIEAQKLQLL